MTGNRVVRTRTIDGIVTPAFIHNGTYFLINMPVFSDGIVNCWEMVDLALFRGKLQSGWVVTSVPDGQMVSIYGLGAWTTSDGTWDLDADALYERVLTLVQQLNPRMENLYDCHGRTEEVVRGVKMAALLIETERPVRFADPTSLFPKRVSGDRISVLVHSQDYWVADLRVFADGIIELGQIPSTETLTFESFQRSVEEGRFVGSVPAGSRIHIHGFGSFAVAEELGCVDPREQVREVSDLLDELNDRPDSVARCRAAHAAYVADPVPAHRDALRDAYEAVPEHNRILVGDMDTRDSEVRWIIYGEEPLR